jgi:hypothetical protein
LQRVAKLRKCPVAKGRTCPVTIEEVQLAEKSWMPRRARLRLRCTWLLAPVLLAGCGSDPDPGSTQAAPRVPAPQPQVVVAAPEAPGPAGERIVARPPAEWALRVQSVNPSLRLVEFRPEHPVADADEHLVFEAFNAEPMPEPLEALADVAARARETCPDLQHFNTFAGEENNYATAVALMVCREDPSVQGARVSMVKTIRGNDYFYVVRRSRLVPTLAAPMAEDTEQMRQELSETVGGLSLYLRSVTLCDDHRPEHPCSSGDAVSLPVQPEST